MPVKFEFIGIDHVQLSAPPDSEQAAREFFGELLGMRELPKPEALRKRGGVWFECGDKQLHIGIERGFAASRKAHPAFAVTNLDLLRARLEAAGHKVTNDDALPNSQRFYVNDPFGNRLELVERGTE